PAFGKPCPRTAGTGSVKLRLNCISSGQEICASPLTPLPCIRRCQSASSAAPTSTFFGSQPRNAHVPPYGSSSTTATRQPAARHRYAGAELPDPVPMTMRSKVSAMGLPVCVCRKLGFLLLVPGVQHLLRVVCEALRIVLRIGAIEFSCVRILQIVWSRRLGTVPA